MLTATKRMLELLSSKERKQLYFIFAMLVNMAFLEVIGIASIMPFMAVVSNPETVNTNKWLNWAFHALGFTSIHSFLIFLGVLLLVFMIASNGFKALTTWRTLRYDNRLNYNLAHRLLAQYLARPYEFFLNRNTADMGKNVLSEVRNVISGVLSAGMQVLSSSLISLFILAMLVVVNPLIAATIAVFLGGIYGLIYFLARRKLARIGEEQVIANSMKYKAASEALSGIKDLKVLGRERVFLQRFARYARLHSSNNVAAGVISQLPRFVLEVVAFGGILLIVLYFLGSENGTKTIIPLLALYAFAGYRLLPAMQQIFSGITTLRFSLAALDVLHNDLLIEGATFDLEKFVSQADGLVPLKFERELVLDNISFSYREGKEPVLKDLCLTIPTFSSIGLVGSTGSGKTTTVDIVLGLLAPSSGRLMVDGVEIAGDNLARWQMNLGYVPQSIFLSDDTISGNIAFGVEEHELNIERVVQVSRIAKLHDFIENELPGGYQTMIGERGIRLSGGQRQRIGIARALYRDPAVLIMDEATSALDGITEETVMDALSTLAGKKTVIMIAHRLTTVKDCDVIYLMENGGITCKGTYEELRNSSEWFRAASRTGETR